jgi:hypothetical protein
MKNVKCQKSNVKFPLRVSVVNPKKSFQNSQTYAIDELIFLKLSVGITGSSAL